jgi:hypothetical protein
MISSCPGKVLEVNAISANFNGVVCHVVNPVVSRGVVA